MLKQRHDRLLLMHQSHKVIKSTPCPHCSHSSEGPSTHPLFDAGRTYLLSSRSGAQPAQAVCGQQGVQQPGDEAAAWRKH